MPFTSFFWGEGSPSKIDYRGGGGGKKGEERRGTGALIPTSLPEDLERPLGVRGFAVGFMLCRISRLKAGTLRLQKNNKRGPMVVPSISILNPGIRILLGNDQNLKENGRFLHSTMEEKNGE